MQHGYRGCTIHPLKPEPTRTFVEAGTVLTTAVLLTTVLLGRTGFAAGEGAFVYPGWEMLESGDWIVPRLFGMVDLRCGVLVAWLQGAAAWMFGQTEIVARIIPAAAFVAMCMACFAFARRWFGRPWGLVAGLACSVTPIWWWEGRSADPQVIHGLFAMLAVCLVIDRALGPRRRSTIASIGAMWGIAAAVAGMLLTAGPSGAPVILAVLVALVITTRSILTALWPGTLLMVTAGGLAWAAWVMAMRSALVHETVHALPPVILGAFWDPDARFILKGSSWAPFCVCLCWVPWRGRMNQDGPMGAAHRTATSSTLGYTFVLSLCALWATGGPTLPALTLLPLCIAGVGAHRLAGQKLAGSRSGVHARPIAVTVFSFLLVATIVLTLMAERGRESAKGDALRLGDALLGQRAEHRELWAEGIAANTPEVLRYACDRAYERGQWITPRWKFREKDDPPNLPPEGSYVVVQTQERVRANNGREELSDFEAAGASRWPLEFTGKTHNWSYQVFRSPPP